MEEMNKNKRIKGSEEMSLLWRGICIGIVVGIGLSGIVYLILAHVRETRNVREARYDSTCDAILDLKRRVVSLEDKKKVKK